MSLIVVGVDSSAGSQAALEFAIQEARFRKATLRVVYAWLIPLPLVLPGPMFGAVPIEYGEPVEGLVEEAREVAEKLLETVVARVDTTGVEVEPLAVEGQATTSLLEAAAGADLLIVGSRGRGGFKGLVLGSVSQQCSVHSPCPVVIVPASGEEGKS
jgi:nucleotide-binding universal stress UspA family protein